MRRLYKIVFWTLIFCNSVAWSQSGWYIIPGPSSQDLYEIKLSVTGEPWISGANGTLFKTTDLGNTWTVFNPAVNVDLKSIHQPASNQDWVAGDSGTVLLSTNGGTGWQSVSPNTSANFNVIFSRGSGVAYAAGDSGTVFYSDNSGNSWAQRSVPSTENILAGINPVSGTSLIALVGGANGIMFQTTDAGQTWSPIASGTTNTLYDFEPGPSGIILAAGANGTILRSTDSGTTWETIAIPTTEDIYSISTSPQNANWMIACGANGTLLKSTTAGVSWFMQASPTAEDLYRALAVSNSVHFAVGANGTILKTTDGGGNPVDIANPQILPLSLELKQNYPNPFNPSTTISFSLTHSSRVSLTIYDVSGKFVRQLTDALFAAGWHSLDWNGTDDKGQPVASGVYLYRLVVGQASPAVSGKASSSFTQTRKLMLIR